MSSDRFNAAHEANQLIHQAQDCFAADSKAAFGTDVGASQQPYSQLVRDLMTVESNSTYFKAVCGQLSEDKSMLKKMGLEFDVDTNARSNKPQDVRFTQFDSHGQVSGDIYTDVLQPAEIKALNEVSRAVATGDKSAIAAAVSKNLKELTSSGPSAGLTDFSMAGLFGKYSAQWSGKGVVFSDEGVFSFAVNSHGSVVDLSQSGPLSTINNPQDMAKYVASNWKHLTDPSFLEQYNAAAKTLNDEPFSLEFDTAKGCLEFVKYGAQTIGGKDVRQVIFACDEKGDVVNSVITAPPPSAQP